MNQLDISSHQFIIYAGIIMYIFGSIGNILSICVFAIWCRSPKTSYKRCKIARTNNSSLYLLASSLANLVVIAYPLLTRILFDGYQYRVTKTNLLFLCKLRYYVLHTFDLISLTCICMATFDRYLISSRKVRFRELSTRRHRTILIILFIIGLIGFHSISIAIFYDVSNTGQCAILSRIYLYYYLYTIQICLHGIIPITFLSIFGILTFKQLRTIKTRHCHRHGRISTDKQLSQKIINYSIRYAMNQFDYISRQLMIVAGIIMIIFGLTGNILNIFVFTNWSRSRTTTNRQLKRIQTGNSPLYLFISSISNCIVIAYSLTTRILFDGYQYPVTQNNMLFLCKLRYYALHTFDTISWACLCMAMLDRYLVSSREVRLRQLSKTRQQTKSIILLIICLIGLHSIPLAIYFDVSKFGQCIIYSTSYLYYYRYVFQIFLHGIIPIIIFSFLGFLTFKQLKMIRGRQNANKNINVDKQLSRMFLLMSVTIIEDMLNEVKFSTYVDTKTYVENIDLNDFIKLYINHRPAFGLNPADLNHAFNVLCNQYDPEDGQPQMNRENLLYLLQQYGEHMSDYEMADCLANLLHLNNESTEMFDTMNAEDASQFIENQLPEQVTLQTFMEDLLKMPSQYVDQVMYSIKTQQKQRSSLIAPKEKKSQVSVEQQNQQRQQQQPQQQRLRSAMTSTTRSTTSASNDS
ncbi:unnamed protein product [Rotaria sp. Silwood2]|nr:unnamed protein product [Rotaria sp. Silwood2]